MGNKGRKAGDEISVIKYLYTNVNIGQGKSNCQSERLLRDILKDRAAHVQLQQVQKLLEYIEQ